MKSLMRKCLKHFAKQIIKNANKLDRYVNKYEFNNEQWFINWQDNLNEISVK